MRKPLLFFLILLIGLLVTPASASLEQYNTSLILSLHANVSPDAPTTFYDSSPYARAVTNSNVVYNTTQPAKFGNASAVFPGTSSGYLSVPASADFILGY